MNVTIPALANPNASHKDGLELVIRTNEDKTKEANGFLWVGTSLKGIMKGDLVLVKPSDLLVALSKHFPMLVDFMKVRP